jgi:hypothetical protein
MRPVNIIKRVNVVRHSPTDVVQLLTSVDILLYIKILYLISLNEGSSDLEAGFTQIHTTCICNAFDGPSRLANVVNRPPF